MSRPHKPGNPLWPIISQIPTPTYRLAKQLNCLLTPYVPCALSLKSPKEFVDILRGARTTGIRASLDVESLFTNVPVDQTIRMMMDRVYRDSVCTPLDIPESMSMLRKSLQACNKDAPFLSPDGHMHTQVDGVAMGSPLGVLFVNFYMGTIEQRVLADMDLRPAIYCKYKRSVVNAYIDRALSHSSGWKQVNEELCRVRQVLVNNGFSNECVEDVIKR
ncbi:uncharacterized protein [Procambarus clarkii]|uniref:uncharacterized protein n=1 Tax=Procambarus clarkii TaxID=6728 RepID=UPI0037420305